MTVPMALLAFLDGGPTHGFALKRRYDELLATGGRFLEIFAEQAG